MKLAYVLKSFPRLSETFILTELLEIERLGCEVTIFSRHAPGEPVPHRALEGLRAEVVDLEPMLRDRLWESFGVHLRLARTLGRAHEEAQEAAVSLRTRDEMRHWLLAGVVADQALARRFDLIHAHFATGSASVARYASRITGVPFSFTAHAKDIYADDVDRPRLRLLLEEAAAVVTVSDANRVFLSSIAPGARIERVYNGVDLDRFPMLPALSAADPPLVLFVGRMVEKKGLSDLLAACAALRAAGIALRCRLVGTGPVEPDLREQARGLGLDGIVEFHPPASHEEVASVHLPAASVFVLPCVVARDGDRDGLPAALVEAMARGVPVVSTRLPGIPEAVPEGEAGFLADPGDVAGLADAVARTLADSEGAWRRAQSARRRVERLFDARQSGADLLGVFGSVARRGTSAEAGR